MMMIVRSALAIACSIFSLTSTVSALAQDSSAVAQAQEPPQGGASGRGVRIIAPETSPAAIVAKPQQSPVSAATPPSPNAARPPARPQPVGTRPAVPPPVLKACDRPIARPTLRFADPAQFDRAMKARLRGGQTVTVDLATPYPVGKEAPAPLGAWLNEVDKSGGTVSTSPYCLKGRGIGGFFAKLFGGGPAEPYKAARRYDAVLHVDSIDQIVTQIAFVPRKADK